VPTLVFLIDVDNTLIDFDYVKNDLDEHVKVEIGETLTTRFWELYERTREESGEINIPLALEWLREQTPLSELDEQTYLHVHSLFDNYPFFKVLYPYALETLHYLRTLGLTVILTDGDSYFQAEKIFNSAIAETVDGHVLIYTHKQEHFDEIMKQYPADHYVMIDDKPQILSESKMILGNKLTTVFVQQGKYAADLKPENFEPDISVLYIGDLRKYSVEQFLQTVQDH
jgi:FMN phosphatase YigB (HAD superfamily)